MGYDKVVDSSVLDAGLKQIANAIREKGGTSDSLAFPTAMAEAIAAIATIEASGGGLPVVAYGSVILAEDQTSSYDIDTGVDLNNRTIIIFWKNKDNTKLQGSLLYASNYGVSLYNDEKISAGYRGGAVEIYSSKYAGIKEFLDRRIISLGGDTTANYSYGLKAGQEYIWLIME